jgi:hypothetical protein
VTAAAETEARRTAVAPAKTAARLRNRILKFSDGDRSRDSGAGRAMV